MREGKAASVGSHLSHSKGEAPPFRLVSMISISNYYISQDLSRNVTTVTTSNKNMSLYFTKQKGVFDLPVDMVEQILLARIWH
jgi:hypothetical protein